MSSLVDRLRGVIGPKGTRSGAFSSAQPQVPPDAGFAERTQGEEGLAGAQGAAWDARRDTRASPDGERGAVEPLGGEWSESNGARFVTVDRRYLPGHRHGAAAIADALPSSDGVWPRLGLLAGAPSPRLESLLFIDLETTGLAGGAGTYAFLVGCAWFEDAQFRIRQFFLASHAAEPALLEAVGTLTSAAGAIVTFNGKSFDVPLIETRYVLHRLQSPFGTLPHLDMLHPARRLWRASPGGGTPVAVMDSDGPAGSVWGGRDGCRLTTLERTLCGHVREGDVPSFEIPARYFHYVRTGDARPLEAVFEHNRLDLISLALVTARAAQLLQDGGAASETPRQALGLGHLFERSGMVAEALDCYARAAMLCPQAWGTTMDADHDPVTVAEALRGFAVLSRRVRRHQDAAAGWRRILDLRQCPAVIRREAMEALAVHHEHRLRDPRAARSFAVQSLQLPAGPARIQALRHRLSRLDRKLAQPESAALF